MFGFERAADAASFLPGAPVQPSVDEPAFEPTIWSSGRSRRRTTSINIPKAEMGQHIGTALARILADELEADWDSVRLVGVDTDPKWGPMVTGASTSVWSAYPTFSRAGAAGRVTLIQEGAKLLGVATEACIAQKGRVEASGRSISYGEIVQRGDLTRRFSADDLKALTIKTPDKWTLIGRPARALDVPSKTTGKAVYGIDAILEGMVYARPKMPPTRYGSKVVSVDDSAAKQVRGYLQSVVLEDPSGTVPGWVMVIAETYPAAIRATELVQVVWQNDDTASVSDKGLRERAQKLIADKTAGAILDYRRRRHRVVAFAQAEDDASMRLTRRPACFISSSSPLTPSPSRRTGSSRSTRATRRRASSCPPSPRRCRFRPRRSSCAPISSAGASGAIRN